MLRSLIFVTSWRHGLADLLNVSEWVNESRFSLHRCRYCCCSNNKNSKSNKNNNNSNLLCFVVDLFAFCLLFVYFGAALTPLPTLVLPLTSGQLAIAEKRRKRNWKYFRSFSFVFNVRAPRRKTKILNTARNSIANTQN